MFAKKSSNNSKVHKKNSVMTEENKVNRQTRKGLCSIIIKLNIGL